MFKLGQPWSTIDIHGEQWPTMLSHGHGLAQPWSTEVNHCRTLSIKVNYGLQHIVMAKQI